VALAADEAALRHAPLIVTHVVGDRQLRPTESCAPEWTDRIAEWRRRVDGAVDAARVRRPGLVVRGDVVVGDPVDVLAKRSHGAALLVIGRRRGCGLPVTSVATALPGRCEVPVLVHRPRKRLADDLPVLVGVEASAAAEPVIAFAFLEASLRRAPLVAIHLWSRPAHTAPAGIHPDAYGYAGARAEEARMLAEALAGWSEKYPEVPVSRTVLHTLDPAVTIADNSRWAQLVVVGATRDRRGPGFAPAAVSRALAEHAACPVAMVRCGR
jgi:nucleotide-binding universal stress UspA family protein